MGFSFIAEHLVMPNLKRQSLFRGFARAEGMDSTFVKILPHMHCIPLLLAV